MRNVLISVAPISMKLVTLAERRRHVRTLIESAADQGARLVCLPEYVDARRTHEAVKLPNRPLKRLASRFPHGEFMEMVRDAAVEFRIGVLFGQCAWVGQKLLNLTVSVDTRGRILGWYAKTHLAPDEGPEAQIDPGERIAPVPTTIGPAGIITCYEVLFPEIARTLHARGAEFLVVPTAGNSESFFTMARARAAENRMPMVFSSYSVERGKTDGYGAAIVDDNGLVLAQTVHGRKVLAAKINLDPPHGCPFWHGRGKKVDLRADAWKRRRTKLYV
jgi:predicted amidohydrolase